MAMPTKFGRKFRFMSRSVGVWLIARKITKKFKNLKIFRQKSENLHNFSKSSTFAANFDGHMKIIEFIAPVAAMRGNLSGTQLLKYPVNQNSAFYSPLGIVNYATNYEPRFIAYRVTQSGRKYFNVRTKTAFHATTRSMNAVSLLGATGAMYASLLNHKTTPLYINIRAQWVKLQELGMTDTFRQYVMSVLRGMIAGKAEDVAFAGPWSPVPTVMNPWFGNGQTAAMSVGLDIVAKFWDYLAVNGGSFTIDGIKGIFNDGDQFQEVVDGQINVLDLGIRAYNNVEYVIYAGRYILQPNGMYVRPSAYPGNGTAYTTTDINPT